MSNLGTYKWMTKTAKKVGGPEIFLGLIAITGAGAYKLSELVVKQGIKTYKKYKSNRNYEPELIDDVYVVTSPGESNEGVSFKIGDRFKVLEVDDEAVLIEKIGDMNNPYYVSLNFLSNISNYKN